MLKFIFAIISVFASAAQASDKSTEWKAKPHEAFASAEDSFHLVMQKLLEKYVDKNISKDDLYRAATAGMLESLNSGDQAWNKLLSPEELGDIKSDLSGQVMGIGTELKFDESTGYAQILRVIPRSPGEKAGLKKDDEILSVGGQRYKGRHFRDLIAAIRGKAGGVVELKVLRDDKILSVNVKRELIAWTPVDLAKVDDVTQLLTIGYFTEETPKLVSDKIREINRLKTKRLIVDLRDNSGGGFDQAVQVAELFLPANAVVANTKDRNHNGEKFRATHGILDWETQLIVLTNKGTFCGAELLVAALRESREAKVVGEVTSGKWNAQTVETLPNGFAMKYTVMAFESPLGHSYQDVGLKPDLEVSLSKEIDARELRLKYDVPQRLGLDPQLKAAYELAKAI